ncbi:unnamed protein product [Symbiodinium sp. CCMP2456]|nr:unnamed protein product [Symbiodinium sp. CCMP2456]
MWRSCSTGRRTEQRAAANFFHVENMPVPQICAMLKTDAERGLTEEMACARLAKDGPNQLQQLPRMSGEIMEMQSLQARLQKEIEANLRVELQRFVVEELQVRRLNELEALQKEDSRHSADIDALRD